MHIPSQLQSGSVSSGYADSRLTSAGAVAEVSNEVDAETAGNASFPALDKSTQSDESNSQDYEEKAGQDSPDGEEAKKPEEKDSGKEAQEKQKLEQDRQQITQLSARDREVRAHEQAHMAVGGQYAGAASYQFERGPDGVSYAIGGEVPISTSKEATPQATIIKAQIVRRAALAPADPSPQDRSVAAKASAMEANARKELAFENQENEGEKSEASKEGEVSEASSNSKTEKPESSKENKQDQSTDYSVFPGSLSGRLIQSISNTNLSSRETGSILDQIA